MSNRIIKRGPPKPPTFWEPVKFRHFLQFVDDLDALVEYFDGLMATRYTIITGGHVPEVENVEAEHNEYTELIGRCRESMRRYDRDGDNDPRYDEDDDLTFEYVSKRLAMMMDGWSNTSKFEDDEAAARFGQTMVQHVLAQEPSAASLESACRKLIDEGKPFAPQTGEVVRAVKAEIDAWRPRKRAIREVEGLYAKIIEEIPKAKAAAENRKAEAEANAARRRAESEAAAARWRAEQEARRKLEEEVAALIKAEELADQVDSLLNEADNAGRIQGARRVPLEYQLKEGWEWYVMMPSLDSAELGVEESCFLSFAIGLFDQRRKARAWECVVEAELEALAIERNLQCAYDHGGDCALDTSSTLEALLKQCIWGPSYSIGELCRVSYALGVFEMRRELLAWRQAWARSKYGIPIWQ
jgi:hypothetical protein